MKEAGILHSRNPSFEASRPCKKFHHLALRPVLRVARRTHPLLRRLRIRGLGQAVLLEQGVDLIGGPEVVVDLARLGAANGGELDWDRC